jgi:hypothetical protein
MIDETNPNNNNISCNNQPTDDDENEQFPPHMREQKDGTRTKRKYPFRGLIVAFQALKVLGKWNGDIKMVQWCFTTIL